MFRSWHLSLFGLTSDHQLFDVLCKEEKVLHLNFRNYISTNYPLKRVPDFELIRNNMTEQKNGTGNCLWHMYCLDYIWHCHWPVWMGKKLLEKSECKNLPEWGEISLLLKYKKTNHYNDALHCTMYYEKPVWVRPVHQHLASAWVIRRASA